MSTRSAIARRKGDGFEGVYHHWDGNPETLGQTLWEMAQERGVKDLTALLIDQHPAGWSSINGADWTQEPGFTEAPDPDRKDHRPECFCHGDRSEPADLLTHEGDYGMEWAYVFDEDDNTMAVCERTRPDGDHAVGMFGTLGTKDGEREDVWVIRAVLKLDGPAPIWSLIECGVNLERCQHVDGYHAGIAAPA